LAKERRDDEVRLADEALVDALGPIMEAFGRQLEETLAAHRARTLADAGFTPDQIARTRRIDTARANWRWN
jgi:hypothetical protein